jgi:hypothetical protein
MSKKNLGTALLFLVALGVAAAVATLLPLPAPRGNDIGYVSLCPFAPWSTLILLAVAGVIWVVRSYILTRVQ